MPRLTWPIASALTVATVLVVVVPIALASSGRNDPAPTPDKPTTQLAQEAGTTTSPAAPPAADLRPADPSRHRILTVETSTGNSPAMGLGGTLEVDEGGCVMLHSGKASYLVVAEPGARIAPDGYLEFPSTPSRYQLGETLSGSGAQVARSIVRPQWRECMGTNNDQLPYLFIP